jgi:ankyrin repeat protein
MDYTELQQGIEKNLPIPHREELWEAIEKGNLTKYTPRQIEQGMPQREHDYQNNPLEYGDTLYHRAAKNGHLDKIPKEFLTKENLSQTNKYDETPLHYAAEKGHLHQVPQELLTKESLFKTDRDGHDCFNLAAQKGHLDQIPKDLLTEENLLQPGQYRVTPLHRAAAGGHLAQIPQQILTTKNLLRCLHFAARAGTLHQIPPLAYKTLRELKTHFDSEDDSRHKAGTLAFLDKQLRRAELQKSIQSCDHPAL